MKRCRASLFITEMQIKTTVEGPLHVWWRDGHEKGWPHEVWVRSTQLLVGTLKGTTTLENSMAVS